MVEETYPDYKTHVVAAVGIEWVAPVGTVWVAPVWVAPVWFVSDLDLG